MWSLGFIAPAAASAASPPFVVGGVLVGLVLFGSFAYMLSRTFSNMNETAPQDRIAAAIHEVADLRTFFEANPSLAPLQALIEGMREAQGDDTVCDIYASALSELTGRYFRRDLVAWDAWIAREGADFITAQRSSGVLTNHADALPHSF